MKVIIASSMYLIYDILIVGLTNLFVIYFIGRILNFIYSSRSSILYWETFASKVLKLISVHKIGNLLKSERSVENPS